MVRFLSAFGLVATLCLSASTAATTLPPRGSLRPGEKRCPPFGGSFVIDYYQLYPENADWDADSCQALFGAVWNGTVAIYDPYANKMVQVLEFPGTSHTGTEHIGGVAWDPFTGLITILTDSAKPWETFGADVSGDYLLMKYNPHTQTVLWTLNLTEHTQGRYGGFQDVETDRRGNTYVVGTWPGTVLRADKHGRAITSWYVPDPLPPTTKAGFGGLAAVPGTEILLSNDGDGRIYRFDMLGETGTPVLVPTRPEVLYSDTDAIYLPPRYGGAVLLVASHAAGIQVLRSGDKTWRTAEYLGTVPGLTGPLYDGSATVAAVQIGTPGSLYSILGFLDFQWVPGTVAGNRTLFPMPDITDQVEALLGK